jgi:Calcineurin-like phosphoesterase
MKILITADLHYRESWFRWLIEQAKDFDLVCIAGDLLDMFGEPRTMQAIRVSGWIKELAKKTRVALCSGNHDDTGRQTNADRAPVYEWLAALGKDPNVTTDGATVVVDGLIVTTVPYHCTKEQKRIWLERGRSVCESRDWPWLVLHHVPPLAYPNSCGEERAAIELLEYYGPKYWVSGHSHQFPYLAERSWTRVIKGVQLLVPGQLLAAPFPNHIILDTNSRQARWETSSKEWIPEDLFSKFPPA